MGILNQVTEMTSELSEDLALEAQVKTDRLSVEEELLAQVLRLIHPVLDALCSRLQFDTTAERRGLLVHGFSPANKNVGYGRGVFLLNTGQFVAYSFERDDNGVRIQRSMERPGDAPAGLIVQSIVSELSRQYDGNRLTRVEQMQVETERIKAVITLLKGIPSY